jgi:hypothetical protein
MCCIVCLEFEKGKLTSKEALSNLGEMINDNSTKEEIEHYFEAANKIMDKEIPFEEWDSQEYTGVLDELDRAFGNEED